MHSFILSHSSCAEQYGDMSSDTHTHSYTIKPPTAGVRQVGHTSIHFVIKSVLLQLVLLLCALCDCKAMPFVYNIHANCQYNTIQYRRAHATRLRTIPICDCDWFSTCCPCPPRRNLNVRSFFRDNIYVVALPCANASL